MKVNSLKGNIKSIIQNLCMYTETISTFRIYHNILYYNLFLFIFFIFLFSHYDSLGER